MRRLKDRLPFYDEERTWDKNLYLVVYDIPIKHNPKRDVFRDALKLLKSAKIQDSVYLTPYNPQELVDRIVKEQNIRGEILVSTIDPNKGLGTVKNIKQFLWETYELEEVNDRYAKFIGSYSHIKKDRIEKLRTKIGFTYLSILQDDPQLPFDLLLNEYLGDKAYLLYEKLMST